MEMKRIANGIWKGIIGTPENHTPISMKQFDKQVEQLEQMEQSRRPRVTDKIEYSITRRGVQIVLPMDSSEDIYGFGLQLHSMNQAGRKRMIRVNSDPAADTGEGHAPIPFYISTAGYGLFVDTFRHVEFYMGTNTIKGQSRGKNQVNKAHNEFSESALYALKRSQEQRCIIIDIKAADGVEIHIFSGNVKQVVQRYNLFSGGGCLPPMWGLGIWYRLYGGSDEQAVLSMAQQLRDEHMPVDVLGLEPGWHSHSYSCTYRWSYLFPNPQQMLEKLNENNFKINLWEHIFVHPAADFYEELLPYAGNYEVWEGLVPDFAIKDAVEIFQAYHRKEFVLKGILGFKLDECDNSDFNPSSWSFPDTTQFPSGMDGEQMHAAIGILYQKLIFDIYYQENKRTYSQARASGLFAAPLPFVLYSDLYNHKQFIRGMVTSSFSGLLWAPEVRDCQSGNDLLRRVETITFSAHAIYNSWRIPNPPWKQVDIKKNLAGELMTDRDYYTETCRRYHYLRMSLLPYLYSAFVKYQKEGIPPVRALVFDYEDDFKVRNIDDQYLFGDNLLAAPMTIDEGTSRMVYLPEGKWYDFFDGTVYEGGREYQIEAGYDKIPVFVKGNCILPLAEPVEAVKSDTVFVIEPRVYGDGGEGFVLYEDDFETFDYKEGKQNRLVLTSDAHGKVKYKRIGEERVRYVIK